MWVFTVESDTNKRSAISPLDSPSATSTRTSVSRGVRAMRLFGVVTFPGTSDKARMITARQSLKKAALDGGVQLRFAGGDGNQSMLDFLRIGVLGQESPRTGSQRREHPLVVGVGGQDNHPDGGYFLAEDVGGLDSVHDRHVKVHQYDVRLQRLGLTDCVGAVDGGPDDGDAVEETQNHGQAVSDHFLIVCDQHPNSGFMHGRLPSTQCPQHLTRKWRYGSAARTDHR